MDVQIALMLAQDGLTNGAIYALLALALVLVFAVTRVIFIPQGEFVAYGALTLAMLQGGSMPATAWLLAGMGALVALIDGATALRSGQTQKLAGVLGWNVGYPLGLVALLTLLPAKDLPLVAQVVLALAVVVPMGPLLYRLVFQPIASAPVLILLIVSVAVHVAMVGMGLLFFGAEGQRTPAFSDANFEVGPLMVSGQTVWVLMASLVLILALYQFFERTLYGKALRATAINRNGARLMGISPALAGKLTFFVAALIGALSGVLIAPITTIYYDTGFLIGLKESFGSFWASAFKEVIVFTLIIPVLLWRSLTTRHVEEEE